MTTEKRKKAETFISPEGTMMFPRLGEPDTKFKDAGEYSVKLRIPAEEAETLMERLRPLHEAALAEGKDAFEKLPVGTRKKLGKVTENPIANPHYDEDENETGELVFNFKMTASGVSKKTGKPWTRKPAVFDAKTKLMAGALVWGGSTGKVSFTTSPYFVAGTGAAGLQLRLEAVQVLDLVSSGSRSASSYGFGEEEGYEAHEDAPAADTAEDATVAEHTDF